MTIALDAGADLGLVLAGGYALSALGLLSRPSRDIDLATATSVTMDRILERLTAGFRDAGCDVKIIESSPRMGRLFVTNADGDCEVDVLKEAIGPPTLTNLGPTLSFDDAVGLKVRALHERAAHRDFVDLHAAYRELSWPEMEVRGAAHTPAFSLEELANRLGAVEELDPRTFGAYGLDDAAVSALRSWAIAWETDIRARIAAGEDGPPVVAGDDWERYLDRD